MEKPHRVELDFIDVRSKAKILNWEYKYGSQSGLSLHHLLIQSIRSNQY